MADLHLRGLPDQVARDYRAEAKRLGLRNMAQLLELLWAHWQKAPPAEKVLTLTDSFADGSLDLTMWLSIAHQEDLAQGEAAVDGSDA